MRKRLAALLLLPLVLALTACRPHTARYTETYLDYFDTVCTLTGDAESRDAFRAVSEEVRAVLERYHRQFDIYREYDGGNNLATLNRCAGVQAVPLDEEILDLLEFGINMYRVTDGQLNICIGSVLTLWQGARENALRDPESAVLPNTDALQEALRHTDIDALRIDRSAGTAYITDPQTSVDVGAVAKGYVAQRITELLREGGNRTYCINLGGNVSVAGAKADGDAWSVGIQDPDGDGVALTLSLTDGSLVTSGDYQRFFWYEGKRYHHIIDPATGYPADRYRSVSVVCSDSATADALSTALFCMTPEQGAALAEATEDCEAYWILSDGTVQKTSDFPLL